MKILEDITSGYKRIATGIAIVTFLTLMYVALIPGGTNVVSAAITNPNGLGIGGAFVKIVEWSQYNTTTSTAPGHEGEYTISDVPYGTYNMRVRAAGYALNTTQVTVDSGNILKNITLIPGTKYTAAGQIYAGQWRTDFRVGNLGAQSTTLDVNFVNLSGVTKNNSEDVISKMESRNYSWSTWVTGDAEGSGTISSEQPIDAITFQRSNSQGKLGFFDGISLNLQNTQWFVPGMIWLGQWRSGYKTLNLGTIDADVSMYFYNSTGILINSIENITIPPKTAPYYDWYTNGYLASGSLPSATDGAVVIVSNNNQPLSVTATQASENAGRLGFWNGIYMNDQKTDVFATGQIWNGPWRSGFKVANIGSVTANVTMYFYNSTGAQINVIDQYIDPKASPYYDWYTYGYLASGSSPSAADGSVRINSTNGIPIYVVETQASESNGFLDFYQGTEINGNNTSGLIYLKFEGGERSGFKIANPGDSPITAVIKFYNASGGLVNTIPNSTIPGKASPYYAWVSYTSEPSGSVTVEADGRISVTASFASDMESKLGIFKGIKEQ